MIRGLPQLSPQAVEQKFSEICAYLGVGDVELNNVVHISTGNGSLYRARVVDLVKRKELLTKAHELANSDTFSRVYINRDLTYHQRQELVLRRSRARGHQNSGSASVLSGANVVPQGSRVPDFGSPSHLRTDEQFADVATLLSGSSGGDGGRGPGVRVPSGGVGRGRGGGRGSGRGRGSARGGPAGRSVPAALTRAPHIRRVLN